MNKLGQLLVLSLSSLLFAGCIDDAVQAAGDDIDDSFLGEGKADGDSISDGTPDALGVLTVASTHAEEALILEVGLRPEPAAAIAAYRAGADGLAGTADDERFETLAELDDVPWVGSLAFARLLTYARANGYAIDPFSSSSCEGQPITLDEVHDVLDDDGILHLPEGQTWTRQRECDADGCGPWRASELLVDGRSQAATTFVSDDVLSFSAGYLLTETVDGEDGPIQHRTSYTWEFELSTAPVPELASLEASYFLWLGPDVTADKSLSDLGLTFTNHCMRTVGRVFPELHNTPTIEQEIVFLTRF